MNKAVFYRALKDEMETQSMDAILGEFPYFQTARLLHLKHLRDTDDIHFDKELKKTAAYAGDRKVLYYLLLQKAISEKAIEIDSEINTEIGQEEVSVVTEVTADEENISEIVSEEQIIETPEDNIEHSESSPLDELIIQGAINASLELDIDEIAHEETVVEEEIAEEKTEEIDISNLSFTEWLKYSTGQSDPSSNQKSIENIIDDFIHNEPKISKPKAEFFSPTELARKSVEDNEDIVTETLANIYLAQGNYKKAIKAFERLSLNYPEKRTYFAARIKSTQDLINEN